MLSDDAERHCYKLSRVLPMGMRFPCNFGSIPRTVADDGDALDLVVLSSAPLFVGCLLTAKLVGVLFARQSESGREIRNDRLLGVVVTEVNPPSLDDLDQIPPSVLSDLENFFLSYNRAHGRTFIPSGRGGRKDAERLLDAAQRRYAEAHE
jgi:inorganic pyrophosphatase